MSGFSQSLRSIFSNNEHVNKLTTPDLKNETLKVDDYTFEMGLYPFVLKLIPGTDYLNKTSCPDGTLSLVFESTGTNLTMYTYELMN